MKLNALHILSDQLENTPTMPVLFLGHGSPMNAIEENEFVQGFRQISDKIETPKAVLCISAHWETKDTRVTAMENPKTIHDFGGFPEQLFQVQYPAPGSPGLAQEVQKMVTTRNVHLDDQWGLDHGAWSVFKHMYPKAQIPVIQLSLDHTLSPAEHYELAKDLNKLRNKGILIVGSGNLVHNLGMIDWRKINDNYAFDWAIEASLKMEELILNGKHGQLINYSKLGRAFQLAIPTPEHFLPLLYTLAMQSNKDNIQLFNNKPLGGSISMTSVKIG